MRRRSRHTRRRLATSTFVALFLIALGLSAGRAVLYPTRDYPSRVDAIVVVAGANDDRYRHAQNLSEAGVADNVLISYPPSDVANSAVYAAKLDSLCRTPSFPHGRRESVEVLCFTPDSDDTEGEAAAATRIVHERGWDSILVITYWGHVSRVRIYFEQCFKGATYVTDTPRASDVSVRYALFHETGGYAKALLKPAC